MKRFLALCLPIICLMTMFGAPAVAASGKTATMATRTVTPPDSQIEATIRTKLAKSKIGKDGFRFKVQRGVVTWEGSTNVMQHKGSATRMAKTAGAAQVVNHIQISASAKEKAGGNLKRASVVE